METHAAIFKQFNALMIENELLAKQNRLFQSFLARHEKEQLSEQPEINRNQRGGRAPKKQVLTLDEKMQIANQEYKYRKSQLADLTERVNSDISLLKAITEATRIRINEMRKEAYEFKRDIVLGGTNARTGRIMAEKVCRYFDDKLKAKSIYLGKMRSKNASLKIQRAKMDNMVRHKNNEKESLAEIDFHQLEIKNAQFNAKKKEKNEELRNLKRTTGKTVQTLNNAKRKLNELLAESKRLEGSIKLRENSENLLTTELAAVEKEVAKERKRNRKFKIQQSNPDMPQVLDYVNQKSEMYHLMASVRNWERKVEIIEMAARRARTTLRRIAEQGYHVDEGGNLYQADSPAISTRQLHSARQGGTPLGGRRQANTLGATRVLPPISR